jgi:hypothetical protein
MRDEERRLLYLSCIIGVTKSRRTGSVGIWPIGRRREMHAGFW